MNTSRKLLIAGAGALGAMALASTASAQASATGTGTASVQVIQPLTIADTSDLSFGRVTTSGSSGTVAINESGARTVTGGVTEAGGTLAKGEFTANGEPNQAVTVTLVGGGTLTVTGTASSATLTGTFDSSKKGAQTLGAAGTGSGAAFGKLVIPVSASLTIPANATSDSYTGTYQVKVDYN
jgi:hypothetical protein